MARPTRPARMLARIESSPSVGDTLRSSSILRRLPRILESTPHAARLLLTELSCDDRVAAVDRIPNHRCRLNDAIENDGEAVPFVLLGNLPELLGALA